MSDTDLSLLPSLPLGPYVHYKGLHYEVLGVVIVGVKQPRFKRLTP